MDADNDVGLSQLQLNSSMYPSFVVVAVQRGATDMITVAVAKAVSALCTPFVLT